MRSLKDIRGNLPDVGATDVDGLDDSEEDVGSEFAVSWQADHHEGSSRAEVVNGLLVGGRVGSSDNGNIGAVTASGSLDGGNEVLGLPEVNPSLSTELHGEVALLSTGI